MEDWQWPSRYRSPFEFTTSLVSLQEAIVVIGGYKIRIPGEVTTEFGTQPWYPYLPGTQCAVGACFFAACCLVSVRFFSFCSILPWFHIDILFCSRLEHVGGVARMFGVFFFVVLATELAREAGF